MCVLILTYWNVNFTTMCISGKPALEVLILTYWNVNKQK